ncbi:WYL domain-containing protein [Sphingopyxis sp.]|uniref:WYL domain-containing protein n=1 Tax=Sphingopyxis sp. TaxID=1908224 RepID=UPI003BA896AC
MSDNRLKLMEAIARRRRITAQYNGTRMTLAPHQLFERHGALFVSALNLDKAWRSDDERRLGHFKLDGLGQPELEEEEFEPLPSFEAAAPRDDDVLLMAV